MRASTLACLLLAGLLVGALEQPYQWLAEGGFRLQAHWSPSYAPGILLLTAAFCLLAWGPLHGGRGGGLTGLMLLQRPDPTPEATEAARATLSVKAQSQRALLMVFTHAAGLTVGTESPSSALGATAFLWLRDRLRPLQGMPLALAAAIGAGAGLGAAFRSPLIGVAYALEELSATKGLSLVLPCALVGGLGALLHGGAGIPAHGLDVPTRGLMPELWPRALGLMLVAALTGALFVKAVQAGARVARRVLQRHVLLGALAAGALLALFAYASGGVSLNDGQLTLQPLLDGTGAVTTVQGVARFLASVVSVAIGAPGGVMHDTMTLGACLSVPAAQGLAAPDRASLAAVGAVAFFSAATGTPLFCALFVFQLQGDAAMLTPLLFCSALSCWLGRRLNPVSWNEVQVHQMAEALEHKMPVEVHPEPRGFTAPPLRQEGEARRGVTMEQTLYQRLGGRERIQALVHDIVDAHVANPIVGPRFRDLDLPALKGHATDFFCAGTGGPEAYSGREMRQAHQGLHISDEEFVAVLDDILGVLDRHGVDPRCRQEILWTLYSLKGDVVGV